MSITMTVTKSIGLSGKTFAEQKSITADVGVVVEKSVPAAKTGVLTVRTDADTGSLTLAASHGVLTGDLLHIYWVDAGVNKRAVCPSAGTVATLVVPIDNCTGDALPTAATAVTVMVPLTEVFNVVGDDMVGLTMFSESALGTIILENDLTRVFDLASLAYVWYEDCGDVNPIAGDTISVVYFSHGDVSAKTMRVGAAYN